MGGSCMGGVGPAGGNPEKFFILFYFFPPFKNLLSRRVL